MIRCKSAFLLKLWSCDASCALSAEKAFEAGGARLGDRGIDHCDDRRVVVPGREPADRCPSAGRLERKGLLGRGRAPLHRRCRRSPISQTTQARIISPTGSPRISTTDLSRLSGSFVIARNTAFTFKGKNVDAREIGRELGVRYVLEGSVQRDAGRMRVNVQLIDAESGKHLWAERFDKPLADLFEMQDEIVARLANQLGMELTSAEAHRAERASNPDSMDFFFQGLASLNKGINPENMAQARGYFERPLTVDPGNLDALLGVGRVDYSVGGAFLSDDRDARLAAAEAKIGKVLSLRPNDALAHEIMGGILTQTKRADQGIAEYEGALALDPNLAAAHGDIGLAKIIVGRSEETGAHENEALRLSPRDSFAWLWLHFAGAAKLNLGAEEEAVALFRRSIENNRTIPLTHFFLAATLANLGKLEEAQAEAKAGLALDPGVSIGRFRSSGQFDYPNGERLMEGMRKAGVPEQ